jgi:hypothetical protein
LREILQAYEKYERSYQTETKWLKLLMNQIGEYENKQELYKMQRAELRQKYQTHQDTSSASILNDEINELKNSFDPIAVILNTNIFS